MLTTVIKIDVDGTLSLEDLRLNTKGWVNMNAFDCRHCGKKSKSVCKQSPEFYGAGTYIFSLFYNDPHDDRASCPINVYSDALLSSECGCGGKETCNDYSGPMYLVKADYTLKGMNKIVDCTVADVSFIQDRLNLRYSKKNDISQRERYCILI